MAELAPSKRQREETQSSVEEHVEETKRHKSYNHILSLLEAEEDGPNQDLSSLITTFQQELSSDSVLDVPFSPCQQTTTTTPSLKLDQESLASVGLEDYTSATSSLTEDEEDKEQVIRHLLEASDDELGIPNSSGDGDVVGVGFGVEVFELDEAFNNGENGFALCDGLWELEDEAANYYTLLQSELFM